jgi:very-short-patch-repair endonuclease
MEEGSSRRGEDVRPHNIVVGQRVSEGKVLLAQQMRREMTPMEAKLWRRLRGNGLGAHFRRQQVADGFIADFYCHAAALVVEVDGAVHNPEYDAERDRLLGGLGISVLRFTNWQVEQQVGVVLYQIKRFLRENQAAASPNLTGPPQAVE